MFARRFGGAVDKRVCYERKSGLGQAPRESMVVSSHLLENETALSRANKCLERISKFCLQKKRYYYTKDDSLMLITRTVCLTIIEIVSHRKLKIQIVRTLNIL